MRARFYHPILRRFLNQDVLLGTISPGIGLNRYAFATATPSPSWTLSDYARSGSGTGRSAIWTG
jgi:hypothetical protein